MASFYVGKESVLLGFVEAVNFVHEDDGAVAGLGFEFGSGPDFLDFFYAGEHGAEGNEIGLGEPCDKARESGFAAAGRSPEKHGTEIVGLDLHAQRFAGTEKFFLADEFVEGARAHALGERLKRGRSFRLDRRGEWREEAHGKG